MKFPEFTEKDANETGNFLAEMTHERDLALQIVDSFEDWLDRKGIVVPDPERDAQLGEGEKAILYGETYDGLVGQIQDVIEQKLETVKM